MRCLWAPFLLLLLLGVLSSSLSLSDADEEDACKKHTNCSSCIISVELSHWNCSWLQCNGTVSSCRNLTQNVDNCTVITSENGTCTDIPINTTTVTPATASVPPTGNTTYPVTRPSNTTVITTPATTIPSTTGSSSPKPTSKPSSHTSTFDAASFIGGIVLVLGLQAVIFFLYKFCKSKEQNYHTL